MQQLKESPYMTVPFDSHPEHLKYREFIVDHPNYFGMPQGRDEIGEVYWHVSSGKTTSLYEFFNEEANGGLINLMS